MSKAYPVFVYLDKGEKVQIGVAHSGPDGPKAPDFEIELTVPLYVEESEDKILFDLEPKDLPEIGIRI